MSAPQRSHSLSPRFARLRSLTRWMHQPGGLVVCSVLALVTGSALADPLDTPVVPKAARLMQQQIAG